MSDITRQELKTILMFGVHMAKVDHNLHELENRILKRLMDAIGLTEEEKSELRGQEISLDKGLAAITSDQARMLLLKTLCAVASVDGNILPEEVDFIERVVVKFGSASFILPKADWPRYEEEVFAELAST